MHSAVPSLPSGFVPPSFLTPNQPAAIVEDPTDEEIRRVKNLTPPFKLVLRLLTMELKTLLKEGCLARRPLPCLSYIIEFKVANVRMLSHHSPASTP